MSLASPVSATDHVQGSAAAKVTLVEYGDYQCPYCGAAYPIIKAVQKRLGAKLQFVFRNFPLTQAHPYAELAAEAAEAAGAQVKFWQMHDALYENQDRLGQPLIEQLVEQLKLDADQFAADLEGRKFQARVKHDFMGGVRSGVNGTPGFFINEATGTLRPRCAGLRQQRRCGGQLICHAASVPRCAFLCECTSNAS